MPAIAGEGDGHRRDGRGLDDDQQGPAIEETPRAECFAQVDAQPSRLGKGSAQLGDGERARKREERRHRPHRELKERLRQRAGYVARGEKDGGPDHHADVHQRRIEQAERTPQPGQSSIPVSSRWK